MLPKKKKKKKNTLPKRQIKIVVYILSEANNGPLFTFIKPWDFFSVPNLTAKLGNIYA